MSDFTASTDMAFVRLLHRSDRHSRHDTDRWHTIPVVDMDDKEASLLQPHHWVRRSRHGILHQHKLLPQHARKAVLRLFAKGGSDEVKPKKKNLESNGIALAA